MDDYAYKDDEKDDEVNPFTYDRTTPYILVAALHFQPTVTKCAFSFLSDPWQFYMQMDMEHTNSQTPIGYQTCAILLNNYKELICFGERAEIEYADICLHDNEDDFYLFSQFTTKLHNKKKNISRDMMLEDVSGKPLLACLVFELYIKALTNFLKDELYKKGLPNNGIRWVIALSAEVSESGKRFIKSCVEQTAIPASQCMLVTESEAAFTFCLKFLQIDHNQTFQDGRDYMIVNLEDCGADITVVRKEKHQLKEKYRTKCRDFVRTSIHESHETRKRDFKSLVENSRFSENVRMTKDKMCVDIEILRTLLKPTIEKVESLFETDFDEYKNETKEMDIVIVGGFADYKILQEVVRKRFLTKRIYIPESPEHVVVQGAVLCGCYPYQYIRSLSSEECYWVAKLEESSSLSGAFITYSLKFNGNLFKIGTAGVLTKLLLGNPELNEQHGKYTSSQTQLNEMENKGEPEDVPLQKIDQLPIKKQQVKTSLISKQPTSVWRPKVPPKPDASKIKWYAKHKKGEEHYASNQNFRKIENPSAGRPQLPPKPDLKKLKAFQKRPVYTAHSIQQDILDKIKKGSYIMNVAPSDLVDFGGQKSFDMTHQLFIQHKGTFILMFNGRKGLNTELDEYPQGNVTAGSILEHWINSILTYCNKTDDKMPRIIFAATHGDKFSEDTLVDIAFQQSTWGQRMPIVWVPLDLQIADLRLNGLKIITKKRVLEINKSNREFALTERRVEDFLLVQHSIGKLLYFDEPSLKDFIVIQPSAMVNILRAFITDRMFWPKEGAIRNILENLASTGVLKKTDLFSLWSQPAFADILTDDKTKEYTVHMLLHLDILVEPKRYSEKDIASELFLVPCMVKEKIPQKLQKTETDQNTICIAYHLKDTVVPSALSFKLIGAAISIWPLKVIDNRFCLYFQAAIMDANDQNELLIYVEGQRIVACLRNKVSKQLISPDLATTTQESLTLALERILQFYRRSFGTKDSRTNSDLMEVELGEICNGETCLIPLVDAKQLTHWCCGSRKEHETKIPLNWVYDKKPEVCDNKLLNLLVKTSTIAAIASLDGLKSETLLLRPNDQHFVQLARTIGISDFYNFFIHLGMAKSDYDNLNFRYFSNPMDFMLMGLFDWRDKTESDKSMASFEDLQKALSAIERQHYLCQVCREDHSLVEIAQNRLQVSPPDHVIKMLTDKKMIGDCVVHLGVELGLSIGNIKETMHNYPRDLNGQIYNLLVKWTDDWEKSNRSKPTIYRLMVVLKRIKAAEGLAFVKTTYDVK
ncbi:unnamed protein product [Mytilus edulis]|uniref:Death domain-containing protein n=1 Tax=Mytilus edulis TaxID=6550 RepID=A0A8S3UR22_MYTED|nr:unnamed protein product [Mytilus edulis]